MSSSPKTANTYKLTPLELKTLFEALTMAPSYMSKRFILTEMLGWSDEMVAKNMKLRQEEQQMEKIGDRAGAYK